MTGYAAISLSQASVPAETPVTATLVIQNQAASSITVSSIAPLVNPGTQGAATSTAVPVTVGQVNNGPGFTTTIPANGSLTFAFPVCPHMSARDVGQVSGVQPVQFSIGALIGFSDGTNLSAAQAVLTVADDFPKPLASVGGFLDFHVASNSSLIL